jgi:hypothetical protein
LALRLVRQRAVRVRSIRTRSYLAESPAGGLRRRLEGLALALPDERGVPLAEATRLYREHRFDVLGSGWFEVRHGAACPGLGGHVYPPGPAVEADADGHWLEARINPANRRESRRIWRLIGDGYVPIDWQLDIKSGFRWSENTYYRDIAYGDLPGVDVKVPWELGRLQHLPQFAAAYSGARAGDPRFAPADLYLKEFRNQSLDFIATNPPRFGVNWSCAMDVAIRVVNLVIALDLFLQAGARFDGPFLDVVARSVAEHARHILEALEWAQTGRGNHYLSDIVGLLFAASYLPPSAETAAWLAFSIREFVAEAGLQFLEDGGNFESSSAYHRLSGELLAFGAALILGLDEADLAALRGPFAPLDCRAAQPGPVPLHGTGGSPTALPQHVFDTLARAVDLCRDLTKPTRAIVQWGDNDSGRLLKIAPVWRRPAAEEAAGAEWREDVLDQRDFAAAAAALLDRADLAQWTGWSGEAMVAAALASGRWVPVPLPLPAAPVGRPAVEAFRHRVATAGRAGHETEIALPKGALAGVTRRAYPRFGHFVFTGPRFFLAIRCAPERAAGPPGHAHDDVLTVELQVDGRDFLTDPGTFVYTPLPAERNRYRSAAAHFCPRPAGMAGADLGLGLFEIANLPHGRCLAFTEDTFHAEATGPGWTVQRLVNLREDRVLIADLSLTGPLADLPPAPGDPPVCIGYGLRTSRPSRAV